MTKLGSGKLIYYRSSRVVWIDSPLPSSWPKLSELLKAWKEAEKSEECSSRLRMRKEGYGEGEK